MRIKSKIVMVLVIFILGIGVMSVLHFLNKGDSSISGQSPNENKPLESQPEVILSEYLFTTDYLNLRSGPGTNFEKIRTLPVGVKVEVLGYDNGWYKISYNGQEGYSIEDYLSDRLDDNDFEEIDEEVIEDDETGEVFKMINGILLVNKDYSLPYDYYPGENEEARENLNKMINTAKEEINKDIIAFSGFRSYNYQKRLYESSMQTEGLQYTELYSAKPGHSEHQTGLAFDLGGEMKYWLEEEFGETIEGMWLSENAHRFGFILRYPKGKEYITGYGYEPWHFRYVGVDHSKVIYEGELTLEEYLLGGE